MYIVLPPQMPGNAPAQIQPVRLITVSSHKPSTMNMQSLIIDAHPQWQRRPYGRFTFPTSLQILAVAGVHTLY